ncbi:undecaprenyl-phosphate galactose phosphotransferase WbaP [Poriferisphaera sp. WC338]|uniref:undecaprenyl-phosphate galactose phosphotransferase WbaP n=1 Tax=Poriferisphaera sp. WC338 TaxID=3425129 RepID=UPI003D817330
MSDTEQAFAPEYHAATNELAIKPKGRRAISKLASAHARPLAVYILLFISDIVALSSVFFASVLARDYFNGGYNPSIYWPLLPLVLVFILAYICARLYPGIPLSPANELRNLTITTTLVYFSLAAAIFLFREATTYSRAVIFISWMLSLLSVPFGRALVRMLFAGKHWWGQPAVIIADNLSAQRTVRTLCMRPEIGLKPVAVINVAEDSTVTSEDYFGVPVRNSLEHIRSLSGREKKHIAIVAMSKVNHESTHKLLRKITTNFHSTIMVPQYDALASLWVTSADLGGVLGLQMRHRLLDPGRRSLKRFIELILVTFFSPVIFPVLMMIAIIIRLDSKGEVFYRQERVGKHGQKFWMIKFRTMHHDADQMLEEYLQRHPVYQLEWKETHKLKYDPRITRVGKFLRKTSLDELPQLLNVMFGEMALVGPRPIFEEDMVHYKHEIDLYKQVSPGITGMWQVSGRNLLTYPQRVALDIYYVRNWSVWLDIYLLSRTFLAVVFCRGAY